MSRRTHRANELFDAVLELDPARRRDFLQEQCGDDAELRRTVEALLRADEACTGSPFLQTPLPQAAAAVLGDFSDSQLVGQVIAGYRLTRALGVGGMGIVFLAESVNTSDAPPVAVKLIRQGSSIPGLLRRFQREGQFLARLRHPNIATLYDAGVTESGVPFLVMEYVDGRPIDAYCDENRLTIAERVVQVRDACRAVQHAHQHLIVHRDIKPANLLVTDAGVVKLLDFGVAKLLEDESTPHDGTQTVAAYRPMTPQYAGPEVVRGEPITTAVDVYALGLVLYELLTGRRPYEVPRFMPREAERIICEAEPRPPSAAIESLRRLQRERPQDDPARGIESPSTFELRRSTPSELRRALRGDLDNVVLKALQKDPKRRFASVEELAQDLERYLRGFPVLAHGDAFAYRARKFLRRHRAGVSVAASSLMLLLLGTAGTTWGLLRAQRESARAVQEAQRALQAAADADRVNMFLQEMLAASDPEIGDPEIRVRDVLDRTARRLETQSGEGDAVRAAAEGTIGQTYLSLGLLEEAERHLRSAITLRTTSQASNDERRAKDSVNLARVLRLRGQYAEAERFAQEAIALDRRLPEPSPARIARDLAALGTIYQDQGDFSRAQDQYSEATAMLRSQSPRDESALAETLAEFGVLLAQRGRVEEGERLCREALALCEGLFPADHVRVSAGLRRLAIVLQLAHAFPEAEAYYRRALAIDRKQLGDRHPNVSRILSNLGPILNAQGKRDEAIAVLRESLGLRRALYGNEHLSVAVTLNNLATVLDAEEAEPLLRESLAISRKLFGEDDYRAGDANQNLAASLKDRGRYAEAEPLFQEAYRILRDSFGNDHAKTTFPLLGLAEIRLRTQRPAEAEPLLRQVYGVRRRLLPAGDRDRLMAARLLAESLNDRSQTAEAEGVLRETVDAIRNTPAIRSLEGQAVLNALLRILVSQDHPEEAETLRSLLINPPDP